MHLKSWFAIAAAGTALTLAAGCDDPSKGKSKAIVSDPVRVANSPASNGAAAETFAFDAKGSKLEFTGAKVTGKHDGSFGSFTGVVKLVEKNPEKSSVEVNVDAASLTADNERLTGHLKSKDFFDVEKHKHVKFVSTQIKAGGEKGATHTITGNLEMHGVTKSITFPATVKIEGDAVKVDSEFSVNRKDFGINYKGKADDLIRDNVVVRLKIHATKKPAS